MKPGGADAVATVEILRITGSCGGELEAARLEAGGGVYLAGTASGSAGVGVHLPYPGILAPFNPENIRSFKSRLRIVTGRVRHNQEIVRRCATSRGVSSYLTLPGDRRFPATPVGFG